MIPLCRVKIGQWQQILHDISLNNYILYTLYIKFTQVFAYSSMHILCFLHNAFCTLLSIEVWLQSFLCRELFCRSLNAFHLALQKTVSIRSVRKKAESKQKKCKKNNRSRSRLGNSMIFVCAEIVIRNINNGPRYFFIIPVLFLLRDLSRNDKSFCIFLFHNAPRHPLYSGIAGGQFCLCAL